MMKNFNVPLLNINGKPVVDKDNNPQLIRMYLVEALTSNTDERLTGEQKFKRYQIAQKVSGVEEEVDLKAEEIVVIKECVGKVYGPLVVGQVFELLDK